MLGRLKLRQTVVSVLRWQTLANLGYLLLGFPLGVLYVLSLLAGLLLGTLLMLTLAGVPILVRTVFHVVNCANLERFLAWRLTGVSISAPRDDQLASGNGVARARALLERTVFWKSLAFLIFKLFLGAATTAASLAIWIPSLILLTAPIHQSERFNMNFSTGGPPPVIPGLIGLVLVLLAARVTNVVAPKVAEIARFALTDTQIESNLQNKRLEVLALASRAASLASGIGASGNLQTVLENILTQALSAVGASAGALLLESRSVKVGFNSHEFENLLESRVFDPDSSAWRQTPFERGLVLRPRKPNSRWLALSVVNFSNNARLLACFETEIPRRSELEFLSTIGDQISVTLENARLIALAQGQAALEERHKLARELHDSVSQALFGIALGARTAKAHLERNPEKAVEPLDYVLQLVEAGVTEMRALIFELRPEQLEKEGLIAAFKQQAQMMRLRYQLETETFFEAEPDVSLFVKQSLLRIAQEALHNTVKHAHASHARLIWRGLTLEISDDGVGFDALARFDGHFGQRTMRERAQAIGARFELETAPGQGTRIQVSLQRN
jgi:signal transduction histidine kinase